MKLTSKKIVVIILAVITIFVLWNFLKKYMFNEQPPNINREEQDNQEQTELKVLGTRLGVTSLDRHSLHIFRIEKPEQTIDVIDTNELGKNGELVQIHNILYSQSLGLFLIVVEDLPYQGGSAGNASWSFFVYDENSSVLQRILTDDGGGSFVPSNTSFSPSGLKLVYVSGIRAGGCATNEYLEGLDLKTFQPFVFRGEVILGESSKQSFINNLISIVLAGTPTYREREFSPINSIPKTYSDSEKTWRVNFVFSDIQWEDDNTVKGKYHLTICEPQTDKDYQVLTRKEITQKFKVTIFAQ